MQPADIEQRIPIRAIAGEARHVDRQDQTNLFEPNTSDQLLEAAALSRRRSTDAEISVDDVDASFGPAELDGALAKRVLQSQTLLVGHHLMGRRLPDVHDRPSRQVYRFDQLGFHDLPPPAPRRPR
ncbi:hypothetical protein GCM10007858_74730 [Bradyrhizobium liaoningense]|nr:hypothetical protein GCM10007858_74730 [Bradyrhizobium liaoningense]